jgi:hypothetical protein
LTSDNVERRLPRHLLNEDGSCFDDLAALVAEFDGLSTADRYAYRGANATAIAGSSSSRLLVVAGPGSGKTHLFLARMAFWLPQDESRRVYVATFVCKLVNDIRCDAVLTAVAEWTENGESARAIGERLGVTSRSVVRYRNVCRERALIA